jgi:hypothetical protein
MIAKGNFHSGGVKLAAYLVMGGPGERAELVDMRGIAASDLRQGFRDLEILAREGTKADAPFFHVQLRGVHGEGLKLSLAQWAEIANRCDKALGPAWGQQPRAVSMHIDEATGDRHMHLAYSRLRMSEDGQLHTINPGMFKNKLKGFAREIEKDFGLKIVSNERQPGNRARGADRREHEESRRLGTNIAEIRTAILDSFEKSDNGRSFAAAMKAQGMELANGDRRDCFVVVDHAGGQHALNKKLTGMTLAEIRNRLADLDRSQLPTVDHAKEIQLDRKAAREIARAREAVRDAITQPKSNTPSQAPENGRQPQSKPLPELGKTAGEIRTAWAITRHRGSSELAEEFEKRGLILVYVSRGEADASHRAHAFAKSINRQGRELREGFGVVDARGTVARIDQRATGDLWEEIQKRLGGIDKRELLTVAQAREVQAEANKIEFRESRQAEREAAKPVTDLEQKILDAAAAAGRAGDDPRKFSAELDKAGIGLARVTAADVKALDALRQDAELARVTASGNDDAQRRSPILADVREGELAAVKSDGSVVRLNPQHMRQLEIFGSSEKGDREVADPSGKRTSGLPIATENFKEGENGLIGPLPSIIELRAGFEIKRETAAEFQRAMIDIQLARRDDNVARRVSISETRAAIAEQDSAAATAQEAKQGIIAEAQATVEKGFSIGRKVAEIGSKAFETGFNLLFGWATAAPALTSDQAELASRAADEKNQQSADLTAYRQNEARRDDAIAQRDEEQSQHLTAPHYFRPITRPAPGQERDDDHERERERER